MFPVDPKIKKTTYTFMSFTIIEALALIYLFTTVGYKKVDIKTQSAVALTGLFILVVFVIAFGKVYYQKAGENNKKKNQKEKLAVYENANFVQWFSLFICFLAGGYFYALRQDLSYFGISLACLVFQLIAYPSIEKFQKDFY